MSELKMNESCRRRNHVHAAYVEAALKIEPVLGAARAIAFLLREGVPATVVSRIFEFPEKRRPDSGQKPPWLLRMLCLHDDVNSLRP